jgi:hypothetical protein
MKNPTLENYTKIEATFLPRNRHGGAWNPCPGAICLGMPGDHWAQYIRSGPEGAQGVLAFVRFLLSLFVFVLEVCSFFEIGWSPGHLGPRASRAKPSKNLSFFRIDLFELSWFFGSLLVSIFVDFPCLLHHFFEHGICIDFSSISVWIWVLFLMVF